MAFGPALYRKLQCKPLGDFEYLGIVNDMPITLLGNSQMHTNTYRDFENFTRANSALPMRDWAQPHTFAG